MSGKLSLILRIIGVIIILGTVAYDYLCENSNQTVYWVGVIGGIAFVIAGRVASAISNGNNDNE